MMRWIGGALGVVALAGCNGSVETRAGATECGATVEWRSFDGAPVAAVGEALPFGGQMIAGRLGPFEDGAMLHELLVGQAPGWGCVAPEELPLAVWSSGEHLPNADPTELVELFRRADLLDLGDGFSLAVVELDEPLAVEAGEVVFVSLRLNDNVCGAAATGPVTDAWRWTSGAGWSVSDGRVVMGARGCASR